jgi:hypothetical protein
MSWRRGPGERRHMVGELYRHNEYHYTFKYLSDGVEKAKMDGFINYPDFPDTNDLSRLYTENIKYIFSLRLIPESRSDRSNYLAFWEANNSKYDWFDELALTQGQLSTDNFEFLGFYRPNKVKAFITDLASVNRFSLPKNSVGLFNRLNYIIEDNLYDESGKAVKLFSNDQPVGYIKKIHNLYFLEAAEKNMKPTVEVKAISQNGLIKGLYVKVFL